MGAAGVNDRDQQFARVYREARVDDQRRYYEDRARRFDSAHRQLLLISALVFGVSAAVSLLAGLDVPGKVVFAIVAAVLPAITTVLSAYEGLYAFDRIAKLYRDAARNLRRLDPPSLSGSGSETAAVAEYVAEVEQVLASERGQWGQLAVDTAPEQARPSGD